MCNCCCANYTEVVCFLSFCLCFSFCADTQTTSARIIDNSYAFLTSSYYSIQTQHISAIGKNKDTYLVHIINLHGNKIMHKCLKPDHEAFIKVCIKYIICMYVTVYGED